MADVKLEFILLGALLQQRQTGYELMRFMETAGRFMRANTSMTQVYRTLRAMEAQGWLSHDIEPRSGAQDAKRYTVTAEGKAALFAWLREPYQPSHWPATYFTQLRFRAQYLGRDAAIEWLDVEIANCHKQIARNRNRDRREWYDPDAPVDVALTSALMEWEHRRGVTWVDSHLEACIELRDVLARGDLPCEGAPALLHPSARFDRDDASADRDAS